MNILVSGGAGFIGSHLVDALVADGHSVVVLDDLSTGKREYVNDAATFIKVDITDRRVQKIFRDEKPEVVFHLAAQKSVRDSVDDPFKDLHINVRGTINLLQHSLEQKVKRFIYSSTGGAIYGETDTLPTPEEHPCVPVSPYGTSKLAGEYYVRCYYAMGGPAYTILRYSNVYGPRQDPFGEAGVVAVFAQKMIAGKQATINGDGENTRDFVYVKDVVDANMKSLAREDNGIYNIGTEKEISINDIFAYVKSETGSSSAEFHGPAKPGEQRRSSIQNTHAERELKWKPRYSLKKGIAETVQWFRQHHSQ